MLSDKPRTLEVILEFSRRRHASAYIDSTYPTAPHPHTCPSKCVDLIIHHPADTNNKNNRLCVPNVKTHILLAHRE